MSEERSSGWKRLARFAPALLVLIPPLALAYITSPIPSVVPGLIHTLFGASPALESLVTPVATALQIASSYTLFRLLRWAPVLVGLGFLLRLVARARVRAGSANPLDRVRAWTAAHPWWARVLTAVPTALWLPGAWDVLGYTPVHSLFTHAYSQRVQFSEMQAIPVLAALAVLLYVLTSRLGVRALLAPTLVEPKPDDAAPLTDEITFNAVAVTRETVGAVGAMMALNVAMMAWLASPHASRTDWPVIGAFTALALGGAALFRRASRVAVGVDGVLVSGSSRTRFFAYRDLDEARDKRGDVELVRGGRVLVRLQLHGDDAFKRDAILARIRSAIERVKAGGAAAAAQIVSAATADELLRAAGGGADYRGVTLTREQLWALVEGPEIEASARRAAAEALVKTSDAAERARLRVVAEQCAAPEVRVELERLAEEEPIQEPEAPGARRAR